MEDIVVFLDSDVLISALLSITGASFQLIRIKSITKVISKVVQQEIEEVSVRLSITSSIKTILSGLKIQHISLKKKQDIGKFDLYVFDPSDAHVVAGAYHAGASFLLTYNTKDYAIEKIRDELDIIVMKPGLFLQYLRSK